MTPSRTSLAGATLTHVAVAALAMGAWAALANHGLGAERMLKAALVQATLSGAITAGLKRSLETMGAALEGPWAWTLPPMVTCAATLLVLVGAHRLAGTPDLWRTIALPYAVSSTYAWLYSHALAARRPGPTTERPA